MSAFDSLRAKFENMTTEQKKQFIVNLQKSFSDNASPDNQQFLDECIAQYNKEVEETNQQPQPLPLLPPLPQEEAVAQVQATPDIISPQEPIQENIGNSATSSTIGNKIDNMVSKVSGLNVNDAVSKVSKMAETVQREVTSSDTVANLKAGTRKKFDSAAKKVSELATIDENDMTTNETVKKIRNKISAKPKIAIGAVVAVVFIVILIVIISSGGNHLEGTWVHQTSTITYVFGGDRVTLTTPGSVYRGTFSVSGDTLTITWENSPLTAPLPFSISGNTLTIGDSALAPIVLTRVR